MEPQPAHSVQAPTALSTLAGLPQTSEIYQKGTAILERHGISPEPRPSPPRPVALQNLSQGGEFEPPLGQPPLFHPTGFSGSHSNEVVASRTWETRDGLSPLPPPPTLLSESMRLLNVMVALSGVG